MAVFDNLNKSTSQDLITSATEYHERALLHNVMPALIHTRDMQMRNLPEHNGRRVQFRRMVPFKALTRPLEEGVTPAGQTMKQTDFWCSIKPYGGHIELTDEINWALIDNMQKEANTLLSDQARLTIDTLARDTLHGGLNVQYANNKTSRAGLAVGDKMTYAEVKKAVRALKKANAKKFEDGFYHGIVGPDTVFDLTADPMWVDVATYQDKRKVETGELGCMAGVKFFETTEAKVFEAEQYLFGTTATVTIAPGSWNAQLRTVKLTTTLTDLNCRELVGKVVTLTKSGASELVKIDTADMDGTLRLRWAPKTDIAAGTVTLTPAGGGAEGVEVNSTLIYGKDHAGGVSLNGTGHNVQVIIKPIGSDGASDPLNQRGTIAWKIKGMCYTILQDAFIVRIEHTVSA